MQAESCTTPHFNFVMATSCNKRGPTRDGTKAKEGKVAGEHTPRHQRNSKSPVSQPVLPDRTGGDNATVRTGYPASINASKKRQRIHSKRVDGLQKSKRAQLAPKKTTKLVNMEGLGRYLDRLRGHDASEMKTRELEVLQASEDMVLYANRDAIKHHGSYKHCTFTEYPDGVDFDGEFTFGFGKLAVTRNLHVFVPYAPRELRLLDNIEVSNCQLLIYGPMLEGDLDVDDRVDITDSSGVSYPVVGGPVERIRLIAKGWLERVVNSKYAFDDVMMKNQVMAEYKRFYRNYPGLAGDVNMVLQERWFVDEVTKYYDIRAASNAARADARIAAVCAGTGLSRRGLYLAALKREIASKSRDLIIPTTMLFTALGLNAISDGAGDFVMALVPLYTFMSFAILVAQWTVYPGLTSILRNSILQEKVMVKVFQPASISYLRKTHVPPLDRVPNPVWDQVKIRGPETEIVHREEVVDMYGVQTDAAAVYPSNSNENLRQALEIRAGFDRNVDKEAARNFRDFAIEMLSQLPDIDIGTPNPEALFRAKYGVKKAEHLLSLINEPLTEKDIWSELFVKGEVYLGKTEDTYKSRMIWNRSLKFLAHHLPACDQVSHGLAKIFNKHTNFYYTSGATVADISNYADKITLWPHIVEMDVSNFDGSVLNEMLEVEKWFLQNKVTGYWPDKEWFIENHDKVWGRSFDGEVTYQANHGRRSGDPVTSCFNSMQNILLTMWVCGGHNWDGDIVVMAAGDDNVTSLKHYVDAYKITTRYAKLGMKVNAINRDSIYQTEFCSGLFWNVGGRPYWGNLPFRQLSKLGMNHGKHDPKMFKSLLLGMSKSLLPSAGHVPVLGALLRAIAKSGDMAKVKPRTDNRYENPYRICGGPTFYPTDETFAQFGMRYGLDEDMVYVLHLAASAVNIRDFPLHLHGKEIDLGVKVDLGLEDLLPRPFTYNASDPEYTEVVYESPLEEERAKLEGASSLAEALENARKHGMEEVSLGAANHHIFLHQLFTFVSYFWFDLGVGIHRAYNHIAYVGGIQPASRNRLAKPVEKHILPMPREMLEARLLAGEIDETKSMEPSKPICKYCGSEMGPIQPAAKKKIKAKGAKGGNRPGFKQALRQAVGMGIRAAGTAAGTYFGQPALGSAAGAWLSKATGFGDYTVKTNSLMSKGVPTFGSGSPRAFRLQHKEFLGDIRGSTAFTVHSYELNPGLFLSFPWLAKIASQYTQYSFKGMIFTFVSTSADALNSTNTALGTVIMATQYNPGKPDYASKVEMEAAQFSCSTRPSETLLHPIECDGRDRPLQHSYVRTGALSSSEDPRLYDLGVFQLATVGMQAEATIGELWVTYDVEFLYPRISPGLYDGQLSVAINNGAYTNNDVFAAVQTTPVGSLPVTISSSGTYYDRILFAPSLSAGKFKIDIYWTGSSTVCTLAAPTFSNLSFSYSTSTDYWGYLQGSVGHVYFPATGATSTRAHYSAIVEIDGYSATGSYIQFAGMTLPSSGTSVDIYISPIPYDYSQ